MFGPYRVARNYERASQARGVAGTTTRTGAFWAIVVDGRTASPRDVLEALVDFARPFLRKSKVPQHLWAWTTTVGDWHLAFYGSDPQPAAWTDGEFMQEPFGKLRHYFHLEHRNTRPREDRVIEFDGNSSKFLGCGNNDYADEFPEPFVSGQSPASNPVYKLLKARTGLTLGGLRRALVGSQVHWLVCEGVVVLPPDSRKRKRKARRTRRHARPIV